MKSLLCISAFFISAIVLLQSCDNSSESPSNNFDRSAMLQNYADKLIIPAYTSLSTDISVLKDKAVAFTNSPNANSLDELQQSWINAFKSLQYINAYNFGPAGEAGLNKDLTEEIALFPVSETKINNSISTGTYNLDDSNRDARGFLAVEFLIFKVDDNNDNVVNDFSSANRKQLLLDLIENIDERVDNVLSLWNTTYKTQFVNSAGTAVGSSTSLLYNDFVSSYEVIKNYKTGLPLGVLSGQTQAEPTKVEAYYSGQSVEMFSLHLDAIEKIWYGQSQEGIDGLGFKEYLMSVEGGPALVTSTETQLASVHNALDNVPLTRFSEQVVNNPAPGKAFQVELQKLTRYFKSDMSSLLGLAITFSSNDGD